MELYPRIWFFRSTLPVLLLPSHFGNCILQYFDLVLCSFITFWYSCPKCQLPEKWEIFFFFKFLATALQSISCVASTMFSSSTNVVTPHSTPNLRDLEWRCKRKIATPKPRQQLPSNKRHQLFRVKVCWWFSGSVPPRSQGRFAPHHAAMIWSVTSQVDVFSQRFFNTKSEMPKHVSWGACAFFLVFFAWLEIITSKCLEIRCHNCLQSIFQQHGRWDMTSLWMCLQYRYTSPIGKWCSLVSYHIYSHIHILICAWGQSAPDDVFCSPLCVRL